MKTCFDLERCLKLWLGLSEAQLLAPETSLKVFERLLSCGDLPLEEALKEPCALIQVEKGAFQAEELWRRLWSEGRINKARGDAMEMAMERVLVFFKAILSF